jgi:hypothetical protein
MWDKPNTVHGLAVHYVMNPILVLINQHLETKDDIIGATEGIQNIVNYQFLLLILRLQSGHVRLIIFELNAIVKFE